MSIKPAIADHAGDSAKPASSRLTIRTAKIFASGEQSWRSISQFPFLIILAARIGLSQAPRPIPPGIRQGEKAEQQIERSIPGPSQPSRKVDPAQLRKEAHELNELVQSISGEIDEASNGLLPKDLEQKLKKVEKLARHLRSELSSQSGIP